MTILRECYCITATAMNQLFIDPRYEGILNLTFIKTEECIAVKQNFTSFKGYFYRSFAFNIQK